MAPNESGPALTSPVLVNTAAIRTAGTQIAGLAPQATAIGPPVQTGATAAGAANNGYYTTAATNNFAEQVVVAMNAVQRVLTDHSTKMNACASAWDSADATGRTNIQATGSGLQR